MTGMYTLAAAAVVGAGTSIYEASQASGVSSQARHQSGTVFGEQQQFEKQLNDLIANPSSVTSLPGYEFQFGQGTDAVARQMASMGFLGSGNEATALTQYGQGLAQNFYTTQANLLAQLAGITAPSSPSQSLNAATAANSNANSQWMSLLGQLGIAYGLGGFGGGAGSVGGVTESQWNNANWQLSQNPGASGNFDYGLLPVGAGGG